MAVILQRLLLVFSIITITFLVGILFNQKEKSKENKIFCFSCLGSAIWSFSFGELLVQTNADDAYMWRSIGMVGTFMTLIFITFLVVNMSGVKGVQKAYFCTFGLLGILIFPFTIRKDAIIFRQSNFGMSYEFINDIWYTLYIVYSVGLAINLLAMILLMIKRDNKKRIKKMGKLLLLCLGMVTLGMVFDTILPLFGFGAFPGSTITQFFGSAIIYQMICYYNSNRITVNNISKNIYYSVNAPTLVFDDKGSLQIMSDSACDLLSVNKDGFRNLKLNDIFKISDSILEDTRRKFSFDAPCAFNDRFCSVEINRLHDDYGDEIGEIAAINDLTEKNRIINQLEEERIRADQANMAKGRFLANMSHEIRTPINTILGMNEMILREGEDMRINTYANNIQEAGESLLSIINDILDFSKIENGMLDIISEEYRLTEMIKAVINMFEIKAEHKGLKIIYDIDRNTPNRLYGDELRIRQILTNLLGNALKYTERGTVTLHIDWKMLDDGVIEFTYEVIDTGIGIKPEDLDKMFISFKRLEEEKNKNIEGTGLGLSIVKQLVNLMNGTLTVSSAYGAGSTFCVTLRQELRGNETFGDVDNLLMQKSKKSHYKESFTAPEAKILIVDDNRMNLEVIRGLLKKTQIQADFVMSGIECLAAVRHMKYDVIFLDHMMPMMDGVETLSRFKNQQENESRETPVIALTANAIHGARDQYIDLGFTDYLSKPVEGKRLEEMLIKYLPQELVNLVESAHEEEKTPVEEAGMLEGQLLEYGMHLDSAFAYCKDLQVFKACAAAFYNGAEEMLESMESFYENINDESWNDYKIIAHAIKTNAKTLGNQELFEIAYMHEHRSARQDKTYILSTKDNFISAMKKMCEGIEKYIVADAKQEDVVNEPMLSDDEFASRVEKIREFLEDFEDKKAGEEMRALLKHEMPEEKRALIKKALKEIEDFKYQESEDTINTLIQ